MALFGWSEGEDGRPGKGRRKPVVRKGLSCSSQSEEAEALGGALGETSTAGVTKSKWLSRRIAQQPWVA